MTLGSRKMPVARGARRARLQAAVRSTEQREPQRGPTPRSGDAPK